MRDCDAFVCEKEEGVYGLYVCVGDEGFYG